MFVSLSRKKGGVVFSLVMTLNEDNTHLTEKMKPRNIKKHIHCESSSLKVKSLSVPPGVITILSLSVVSVKVTNIENVRSLNLPPTL